MKTKVTSRSISKSFNLFNVVIVSNAVTTIDVLKLAAVVLMIADHVGLYVFDNAWLRVAGRPVAVIFGFLIGYAATIRVPPIWIGLGIGLSLLNRWLFPDEGPHSLDILIILALTRVSLPLFDRLYTAAPLLLVPAIAVLALLTEPVNAFLEYGTEVPIAALLGVAVRLDRGLPGQAAARWVTALAALVGLAFVAIRHFEFTGFTAVACLKSTCGTLTKPGDSEGSRRTPSR